MIERPADRDLTLAELRGAVAQVAIRPELWMPHMRHDTGERAYERLLRDEHLEIWLICWSEDHDTGFHDHDVSAGAVAVVAGAVREERLRLAHPSLPRARGSSAQADTSTSVRRTSIACCTSPAPRR